MNTKPSSTATGQLFIDTDGKLFTKPSGGGSGGAVNDVQINGIPVLSLAHVGDAVYEILVRTWLCTHGRVTSKGLHKETVRFVAAPAQAKAMEKLLPLLSEAETNIYRRGRNTRVNSVPQHANIQEYHTATGLESLFGWLWLRGDTARIEELFAKIMEEEDAS